MTNRTSRGDRRNADARRSTRHQRYMNLSVAIEMYCRAVDRIRPYLDQAGWIKIDQLPSQVGWEQAAYQIDEEYMLMRKHAREAAQITIADCTCLPDADACLSCSEEIHARYGDEIPFEAQS